MQTVLFSVGAFVGALGGALVWLSTRKLIVQGWGRVKWTLRYRPPPKFDGPRWHLIEEELSEPVEEEPLILAD